MANPIVILSMLNLLGAANARFPAESAPLFAGAFSR
jgi:hypothetical protein